MPDAILSPGTPATPAAPGLALASFSLAHPTSPGLTLSAFSAAHPTAPGLTLSAFSAAHPAVPFLLSAAGLSILALPFQLATLFTSWTSNTPADLAGSSQVSPAIQYEYIVTGTLTPDVTGTLKRYGDANVFSVGGVDTESGTYTGPEIYYDTDLNLWISRRITGGGGSLASFWSNENITQAPTPDLCTWNNHMGAVGTPTIVANPITTLSPILPSATLPHPTAPSPIS